MAVRILGSVAKSSAASTPILNSARSSPWRIAIIGGGPAGLTLARALKVENIKSRVFEAETGGNARWQGGSLDLKPDQGRRVMKQCKLEDEFKRVCRPEGEGVRFINSKGKVLFSEPSPGPELLESSSPEIDRGDLRNLLLASLDPDTVEWGHKFLRAKEKDFGNGKTGYELEFANGVKEDVDLVVGADGTFSKLRQSLSLSPNPTYAGVSMVGFTITPSKDSKVKEEERLPGVEEFVGQGLGMASDNGKEIILQRNSNEVLKVYAAQLLPENTVFPSDVRQVKERILEDFKEFDDRLLNFFRESDEEVSVVWKRYTGDPEFRREVKLGAELVGDANMALTGEGANIAMEDAADLATCLAKANSTLSSGSSQSEISQALLKAQEEFQAIQYPRTKATAEFTLGFLNATFHKSAEERFKWCSELFGNA